MKKPRNSSFWTPGSISSWRSASKANVPSPSWLALTTYRPMTAASMIRPPTRLYSKNFTAAYWRRGPPKLPMMKYIGTSIASKKT